MYYYGIIIRYNGAVTFDQEHKSSEQETNPTGGLKAGVSEETVSTGLCLATAQEPEKGAPPVGLGSLISCQLSYFPVCQSGLTGESV